MNILWFSWKDIMHPFAGGAEKVDELQLRSLVKDGHNVVCIVGGFKGGKHTETINGYKVIRVGNAVTVYWEAFRYYKKHYQNWADVVIEEINTVPFMTQFYVKEPRVLLIYQLCREIWFYQLFFPLNIIGYLLEPIYLWLLSSNRVLTESESTKTNLQQFGFQKENIQVFPISIDTTKSTTTAKVTKYDSFTVLSLGSIRSMKRTLDQIKAFEIAKEKVPDLNMKIAGTLVGGYGQNLKEYIKNSPYQKDIEYLGNVTQQEKYDLMKRSHVILVTSVKEGWGLIVTESASQGTPAIVYDVDGLRDSVKHNKTGLITKENTPDALAQEIIRLHDDQDLYKKIAEQAWKDSGEYTDSKSYQAFTKFLLQLK